jgi:hypothetical protein
MLRNTFQPTSRWKASKGNSHGSPSLGASGINNDDAGIFVTCDKGQENKCLREMDDILSEVLRLVDQILWMTR